MEFAGRVAVVTGAARGIGAATARAFAREGARVVVVDLDAAAAEALADELGAAEGRALALAADVSRDADARRIAAEAVRALGGVDVLVNNAGIMDVRPFVEQDLDTWRATVDTNLYGLLVVTRELLPSMIDRQRGRIICLSSQLAHVGAE